MKIIFIACLLTVALYGETEAHARLRNPPSRSSLWRDSEFAQFQPEPNYSDNQLFCGGFQHQYEVNGGKCGLCGDAYDQPQPRENEGGGLYGRGIIVRKYKQGQEIDITIELTASHLGYFQLKLCPHNNPLVPSSQECLDQYPLELADGSGTQFKITSGTAQAYSYKVKLPENVTCDQCVIQFHYQTGNSWGWCDDGTGQIGCGDQEVFRACADVAIA